MVYLDNHATTVLDRRVLDAMMPALTGEGFGNPSSSHLVGVAASRHLEQARTRLAELIPGPRRRIVFTSGASEANAMAVLGRVPKGRRRHLVVSGLEHPSVLESAKLLQQRGCQLTIVAPDEQGLVAPEAVAQAVTSETALVAVMLVNNEIGTVQEVDSIARLVHGRAPACHVHVDAVQAWGWVDLNVLREADSISLSAHKIHGPKGVGLLAVREESLPRPLWLGGGQEQGLRSGTVNVAGAVGLAAAAELAWDGWRERARQTARLRDQLVDGILGQVSGTSLVGHRERRSPVNAMVATRGLTGDVLAGALEARGVIVSTGSACHAGAKAPSGVLSAIGHDPTAGPVRFGLSRLTTAAEVEQASTAFVDAVATLRGT